MQCSVCTGTMSGFKRGSDGSGPASKKGKAGVSEDHCVNTIRLLSADAVEKAKSGHPGAPMGCAPMAHVLFGDIMKFNPANPDWFDRDRFVLSNGHACALLYSMLHLTGYDLSMEDMKQFRQLESKTPGHPENFMTAGVEVSTGPLGQGISNAVGMAIAEKHLAATFNKDGHDIVGHHTFVICGDGCLQEGVSSEASSLAGHLGLGKLIVLYDDNKITIDGDTALSFTEDVKSRYEAYGWQVLVVEDGNDIEQIRAAVNMAKANGAHPSMIKIRTKIGHGSSKEGSASSHGAPLGKESLEGVKTKFGFNPEESFKVDDSVYGFYHEHAAKGKAAEAAWHKKYKAYKADFPAEAGELDRRIKGVLPSGLEEALPTFTPGVDKKATRACSEAVLNAVAAQCSEVMGGSADLTPSNLTSLKCSKDFQGDTPDGRYIRFGVREHGMAAICNGMFAHGALRPYCATFLNFIGYALGSVRVSALSNFGVVYVMTHDSIGLGEDGPTHQPIEMLETLRAMPNLNVFRPADGNEVAGSYLAAMNTAGTPSVISLSRQGTPTLAKGSRDMVSKGAYTVYSTAEGTAPALILAASGTEVDLAIQTAEAAKASAKGAIQVVSMPCWELFDAQPLAYRMTVFPAGVPVMSIEASGSHGWSRYAHASFGMERFGLSAPGGAVYEHFGFTVANLSAKAQQVMQYYEGKTANSLIEKPF